MALEPTRCRSWQTQNLRFDAALNNMSQGLCMFDGEHRLVVCNARYAQMYGLPAELTAAGHAVLRASSSSVWSRAPEDSPYPEKYVRELAGIIDDNRHRQPRSSSCSDGRVLAIEHQPMPDGGWIAMHEDITEQRRIEARIAHLANHDMLTDLPNRPHVARAFGARSWTRRGASSTVAVLSPRSRSLQGYQRGA